MKVERKEKPETFSLLWGIFRPVLARENTTFCIHYVYSSGKFLLAIVSDRPWSEKVTLWKKPDWNYKVTLHKKV